MCFLFDDLFLLSGMIADGKEVRVTYAESPAVPLLDRLQPRDAMTERAEGGRGGGDAAVRSNGAASDLSDDLLSPYTSLLNRAGVDSLPTLRKLLRRGSVKEYIDDLAKEYPDEELLRGFTAKWSLKDRLEDWLDVKRPGPEWERRDA